MIGILLYDSGNVILLLYHEKRVEGFNGMKNLRKLVGISILFVLVAMVVALVQFREEEELSDFSEQIEYYFGDGWGMVALEGAKGTDAESQSEERIWKWTEQALENNESQKVELPYTRESQEGELIIFQNILPQNYAGTLLRFSSADSAVCVMLDGKMIYQYGVGKPGMFEEFSSEKEHFVTIPRKFQTGELRIVFIPVHPNTTIVFEDTGIVIHNMVLIGMGDNIFEIVSCLLIIIMAIIMFILALIRRHTNQPTRGELFLGLADLAAGIYYFIGTDILSLFYEVHEAYEMQEYLVLLLPLFIALYFERNFREVYPRRFSLLLGCVQINAVGQILLQVFGIRNMVDMIGLSAVAMAVVSIVAIVSLMQYDYHSRSHRALLSALSMLVLITGEFANVFMNIFFDSAHFNKISQYTMTAFSIMMAILHVFQISKEYRSNAEKGARLLEEKVKEIEQQNTQLVQAKKDADVARHEALAANESKGKFLAHMSHEIRTPINAVLGMDEMILRESKEANIRSYAMDIYLAGQTLLSLINDILDFSKIDSGKMEIVPVEYDVSSMIHDLSNMTSQRAESKNLDFRVEVDHAIPSRLYGDDVRVRQILTNILTNAVKYTHEGTIWLRVKAQETGDTARLWFEVEDTGIGIKEEDLPKLSAEFERIEEDRNRNIEGTGLGMSITIQLLALLGSKLQMESIYGKGSKFYFELEQQVVDHTPIGDFESRVRQITENYSYSTRLLAPDAKILVVDDNGVNRKVFRNLIKETQVQVTEAASGMECLELVEKNQYDLIFLDHMMPEMDGIETLHRIKEIPDCPCESTPIIVLTANAVSGAKERYLSEGFDEFLSKPIVPEKLENMMKEMLPEDMLQEVSVSETQEDLQQAAADRAGDSLEELPQVDGLDWNYAWLHLPDMELLEYTVKEFYGQIEFAAEHLELAFEQIAEPEQLEQYRIQVHAMKSLAATIGIVPLAGLAKLLEYAAKDGRIDMILSLTGTFLEEWRSYQGKLQGVFGIEDTAKAESADDSVVQALVEMVRFSMQEMDIDQADQSVRQLRLYEYPEEIKQNIKKLAEAVTNLDVEETERLADVLIRQISK